MDLGVDQLVVALAASRSERLKVSTETVAQLKA
jgi:hypothetical protein